MVRNGHKRETGLRYSQILNRRNHCGARGLGVILTLFCSPFLVVKCKFIGYQTGMVTDGIEKQFCCCLIVAAGPEKVKDLRRKKNRQKQASEFVGGPDRQTQTINNCWAARNNK